MIGWRMTFGTMKMSSHPLPLRRCRLQFHPLSVIPTMILLISSMAALIQGFNNSGRQKVLSVSLPRHTSSKLIVKVASLYSNDCLTHSNLSLKGDKQLGNKIPIAYRPRQRDFRNSVPLRMTSADVSNTSKNTNLFVKIWNWLRKLLSRIFHSLRKPFLSVPTKSLEEAVVDKEDQPSGTVSKKQIQDSDSLSNSGNSAATSQTNETTNPETLVRTTDSIPDVLLDHRATASPTVDLTGNWTLIVDDAFQSQYDDYLRKLGQPMLVRTVARTVIGSTREETRQMNDGQRLFIRGVNVRGSWERTLEASARTKSHSKDGVEGHDLQPMITADDETVQVASWWEENGTVHKSWVIGGQKYGGGDFENKRFLTDDGNILVCESIFHPSEEQRDKACVTWRFLKEGAIYGEKAAKFPNLFDVFAKKEEHPTSADEFVDVSGKLIGDDIDNITTPEKLTVVNGNEKESWVAPVGERWAICSPGIDLSGKWKLIMNERFQREYDAFLQSLGQPLIVRGTAVMLIGGTREETRQSDGGRLLCIKGLNAKGVWERTLISSGSDSDSTMIPKLDGTYDHTFVPITTADSEKVLAESWWERNGTVHVSWTHGVKKYGGGSFESKRFLEKDGNVYVCESTFHPNDSKRQEKSFLTWKFLREGSTLFIGK